MKQKYLVVAVILSVVILLAGIPFAITNLRERLSTEERSYLAFRDEKTGLEFSYAEQLTASSLSEDDRKDKFIARLTSQNPVMLVSVRYEEGLRAPASLSHQDVLTMILNNIDKVHPARYPEYKEVSRQKNVIGGNQAAEIIFTYKGSAGLVKQRMAVIVADENKAYYIAAQAEDAVFSDLNAKYFDGIFSSLSWR